MIFIILQINSTQAKEVSLKYKGLTLNAALELDDDKTVKDGVVLITHGSLAHRDMQTITYLRSLLNESGYNTLAINLSMGINNRHGMYNCKQLHTHTYNDAVSEIGAWVKWLKDQGVKKITLLGHSKGGAQTALYAAEHDSKVIESLILIAPAMVSKDRSEKVLSQIKEAKRLDAKETLKEVPIMHCQNTTATVESFLSYNAFSPKHDTPTLLPKIKKPTLVLIGGQDSVVVGLEKIVAPLVKGNIQMKVVDTAGHFFRDLNMDEAVEVMDLFLQKQNKKR